MMLLVLALSTPKLLGWCKRSNVVSVLGLQAECVACCFGTCVERKADVTLTICIDAP